MSPDEIKSLPPGERLSALKDVVGAMKSKNTCEVNQFSYYAWKRKRRANNRRRVKGMTGGGIL